MEGFQTSNSVSSFHNSFGIQSSLGTGNTSLQILSIVQTQINNDVRPLTSF